MNRFQANRNVPKRAAASVLCNAAKLCQKDVDLAKVPKVFAQCLATRDVVALPTRKAESALRLICSPIVRCAPTMPFFWADGTLIRGVVSSFKTSC